jgi:DNA-binding CsgD family transcriptional regulator
MSPFSATPHSRDDWPALSAAERRIGSLLAKGCPDEEIGRRLLRSTKSVEWAVAKLCRKLDVSTRAELRVLLDRVGAHEAPGVEHLLRRADDGRGDQPRNQGGNQ